MANHNGTLKLQQTFRIGVVPTRIEAFRNNGQVSISLNLELVKPEDARKAENGPVQIRSSTNTQVTQLTNDFFKILPVEIPADQEVYKPSSTNVLMGSGFCFEDNATSKYWRRPRDSKEKAVQTIQDPRLITTSTELVNVKRPDNFDAAWIDAIQKAPTSWFHAFSEITLVDTILAIFTSGKFEIRDQVAVACKVTHLHRNTSSRIGKVMLDRHDNKYLTNRIKRFSSVLNSMEKQLTDLRIARNQAGGLARKPLVN